MITRLFLIAVVMLGGCASTDYVYTKAGATQEQKEIDKTNCLVDARTIAQGPGGGPTERVDQDRYRRCMTGKGYTLEKVAK
jgi:hypothetical protein